jgi:hypothetical protein
MCLHVSRSMGSSLRPRHGKSRLTPAVPRGLPPADVHGAPLEHLTGWS